MAKSKALTPQEIYRQRKQREEREKAAYLPPGLINHGNTCFMNSVLQGLLATRLLADLVYFKPVPSETQGATIAPILSARSPQLTNGHYFAGKYKQPYVVGMPIGDVFLETIDRAWVTQANRRREVLSPRMLLTTLGRKYDQYLDFAQQDAHEFLRILLDAMRMEEFDMIKVRQPPPPPKKRRRTTITPADMRKETEPETHPPQTEDATNDSPGSPPLKTNGSKEERPPLMSFVDMIFAGQLTSILVCQKCKHVSQTYEDFNDISLSLKPEDYANRKRDRFRRIVGRLTGFPTGNNAQVKEKPLTAVSTVVVPASIHPVEMQRSSSVPSTPSKEKEGSSPGGGVEGSTVDLRRRSLEVTVEGSGRTVREDDDFTTPVIEIIDLGSESGTEGKDMNDEDGGMGSDGSHIIVNMTDDRHVEFIEVKKEKEESSSDETKVKEKKSEEAAWTKIGRRISLNLGLGRQKDKEKDRKERERKSRSADHASLAVGVIKEGEVVDTSPMQKSQSVPSISNPPTISLPKSRVSSDQTRPSERPPSQSTQSSVTLTSNQENPSQGASQGTISLAAPKFPTIQRSKSPKPPKPTPAETEYLRRVLADVSLPQSNPFTLFRPPLLHHDSSPSGGAGEREKDKSGSMWLGLGSRTFSGIEECLRMFTAVEVLDGENMVGCRRCWKIRNGVLQSKKDSDQDDEDDGDDEPIPVPIVSNSDAAYEGKSPVLSLQPTLKLGSPTPGSPIHIQASQSTPTVSFYSQQESHSVSSLPTFLSDANLNLMKSKPGEEHSDSSVSFSMVSERSSVTAGTGGAHQQTPGGLPIPIISTTAPVDVAGTSSSASTDSESESHYSSASEGKDSDPSDKEQASYAHLTGYEHIHMKDSLAIPIRRVNGHHRQLSPETSADEGSSEDESDTSIGTSVSGGSNISRPADVTPAVRMSTVVEPSPCQGGQPFQHVSLQRPNPGLDKLPKKPSKPKPVIMRPAYKRYLIATPPPVLVVHLKRFQQTSKTPLMLSFSHGFKKLDDFVSFPEYLDLSPFLAPRKEDYGLGKKGKKNDVGKTKTNPKEERCMYRLYAVVVHIGNMLGGHYIAYTALPEEPRLHRPEKTSCTSPPSNGVEDSTPSDGQKRNEKQNATGETGPPERQWAYVSDTHVRLVSLEEVLSSKAYICMYERC